MWGGSEALRDYSDQLRKIRCVFSAAENVLRIYKTPIHLNGARWRTKFLAQRKIRRRKKTLKN